MKEPRLAKAMEYLDDDLISEAEAYVPPHKKWKIQEWTKWGKIAACIAPFIIVPLLLFVWEGFKNPKSNIITWVATSGSGSDDSLDNNTSASGDFYNMEYDSWTSKEALESEAFGAYFPQTIMDGYRMDDEVHFYDCEWQWAEASYINEETGDILWFQLLPRYSVDEFEMNKVYYGVEPSEDKNVLSIYSYLFVDYGKYIAYYSSYKSDLETLEGFQEMVYSAKYFEQIE